MIDESTIRQFLEVISGHACSVINDQATGVLQMDRISPRDSKLLPTRFELKDVDRMVATAVANAAAHNVYIEGRTVRGDLPAKQRGELGDTRHVFALVIDSDADKGMGATIAVKPSLVVETSPGNFHYWFLLACAIDAGRAQQIGQAIRDGSGADKDSGVVTQCYRVPGTPNFPGAKKQARGRVTVEPTHLVEYTGRLWDPDELLAAFPSKKANSELVPIFAGDPNAESTLPEDLLADIQNGGNGSDRSAQFHKIIRELKRRRWSVESILQLLEKYPNGAGSKYAGRLEQEIARSYNKISAGPPPPPPPPGGATAAGAGSGGPAPHVLPTIRLISGQLPRIVAETEAALRASGAEVFTRAGTLVYPVMEHVTASDGRKTMTAKLSAFNVHSLIEPIAESAIFQRYNERKRAWLDADPPPHLVSTVLARESRWTFPRVSSIITTPTLRADGSLLATPGYDTRTELYLMPGLTLPLIPEKPTKDEAQKALALLKDLFREFSFKDKKLDGSVALAGLLTALLRGSMSTAPVCLVRGDTPGVGKSYLIDTIAAVATGRVCPVITTSHNEEETEKRIGAILLSGSPIASIDNAAHDLGGDILCQLNERPIVSIRILGRSEITNCECRCAVFATGNGITFRSDMTRRGLLCNLEANSERPELHEYSFDALQLATDNRADYVAAALTIVRGYLTAGAPKQCGPLGSYAVWSKMVRSPLIWLGESDPILSMDEIREDDPELTNIREFFELWKNCGLNFATPYTTAQIIEFACTVTPNSYNPLYLKNFLLRVAADRRGNPNDISPERLGRWLRRISGRHVDGYKLVKERDDYKHVANFQLVKV